MVARNGAVIEQSQVLTTHNLALLFREFGVGSVLSDNALPADYAHQIRHLCVHLNRRRL